jgi:hypothetical protein
LICWTSDCKQEKLQLGIHVSHSMHEIHACQDKIMLFIYMLFICMSFFILDREAKTLDISICENVKKNFPLVVVILKFYSLLFSLFCTNYCSSFILNSQIMFGSMSCFDFIFSSSFKHGRIFIVHLDMTYFGVSFQHVLI